MNILSAFFVLIICATSCASSNSSHKNSSNEHLDNQETTVFYPKNKNAFRIVTYNVGALSKYMENSTGMVANMLKEAEADLISLNELDSLNTRHMTYQLKDLADAMGGCNCYYGKAMDYKNGGYGNGIITHDKIINQYTVILDKGAGSEQRSMAVIETEKYIYGAAHLDCKSTEAQLHQAEIINGWAASLNTDKPVFFAGDMNCTPESATIAKLKEFWDIFSSTDKTYGSINPTQCIDYIFHYKNSQKVNVLGTSVMTKFKKGDVCKASDHLPVYVDIML